MDALTVVVNRPTTVGNSLTRGPNSRKSGSLAPKFACGVRVRADSRSPHKVVRRRLGQRNIRLFHRSDVNGRGKAIVAPIHGQRRRQHTGQGVSRDPGALGFFGWSYEEIAGRLKAIAIDNGRGPIRLRGKPLRHLSASGAPAVRLCEQGSASKPHVAAFMRYYLANAPN
jgi:hypothetical protein